MADTIEVFQDLAIDLPEGRREAFRADLILAASDPWRADLVRSRELAATTVLARDVILFQRSGMTDLPDVGLSFWATDTGYYVANIVPTKIGQLSRTEYNMILADFVSLVLDPVVERHGATIRSGKPRETASDWLGEDAAIKLRRFSGAANKSTGASHPMDQRRWFDFIVAVHRAGGKADTDRLARWLHTVDGWDEASALDLAGDFEHALSLLAFYDQN